MVVSRALITIVSIAVIASLLAVVINLPSLTPYSPFNNGPTGYLELVKMINAQAIDVVNDLRGLNGKNVVLIIPLVRELSNETYDSLKKLVSMGSTLIILDEEGYSNDLLKYLGINAGVSNYTVLDEVLKFNDRFHPVIRVLVQRSTNTYIDVVTYRPSYIIVGSGSMGGIVGSTSNYAYADLDGNEYYSIGEEMKSYIVIHSWNVSRGKVVLISDLDLWSNDLIGKEGNAKLLKYLTNSGRVFLLTSGLKLGFIDEVKYLFMRFRLSRYYGSELLPIIGFLILMAVLVVVRYAEEG